MVQTYHIWTLIKALSEETCHLLHFSKRTRKQDGIATEVGKTVCFEICHYLGETHFGNLSCLSWECYYCLIRSKFKFGLSWPRTVLNYRGICDLKFMSSNYCIHLKQNRTWKQIKAKKYHSGSVRKKVEGALDWDSGSLSSLSVLATRSVNTCHHCRPIRDPQQVIEIVHSLPFHILLEILVHMVKYISLNWV